MSQIPALIVAPRVETRLGEQLLVKPLPACPLEEGLVWYAEGRAGESMPEGRVLMVCAEGFLDVLARCSNGRKSNGFTVTVVKLKKSVALR